MITTLLALALLQEKKAVDDGPKWKVGGVLATPTIQIGGEYELSAELFRTNLGVLRGLEYTHWLEYTVDGERVHLVRVGGPDHWQANLENNTLIADQIARAIEEYPDDWIEDAFEEAVAYNRRSWRYVSRILENWTTEGRQALSN